MNILSSAKRSVAKAKESHQKGEIDAA